MRFLPLGPFIFLLHLYLTCLFVSLLTSSISALFFKEKTFSVLVPEVFVYFIFLSQGQTRFVGIVFVYKLSNKKKFVYTIQNFLERKKQNVKA
jgi:hypothetical protein